MAQRLLALTVVLTHTPVGFAEILRKPGPPPVFTGPAGSAGGGSSSNGGGSSSGGGPFVRFETAEQQKKVFPTVQLGKGEGAIIVEMDRSRKKAELAQLLNMATDLPGMIKEEQAKGLTSFESEKKSIESSERANRHVPALSGSHVQVPGVFEVEHVVGFTDSGTPVPRNGYRDLSATAIASFQATNRSIHAMNFSDLVLSISQDREVAAAVGVDVIVGGVVRPFFNFTAKVGDEMVRTVQCATQGMGVSTGCSTPTEFQDYWGSLMTGEGQSYTAGAIALDAIAIGAGPTIAGMTGDAAAAVLKKVPEGLEAVAKSVGRGVERLRTGYAASGFADETGQLLIREGERIGIASQAEATIAAGLTRSKNLQVWNPLNPKGPLDSIKLGSKTAADTFRGNAYISHEISEPLYLYRVNGGPVSTSPGDDRFLGRFWSRTKPEGPTQAIIDSAIDPSWGNNGTHWLKIEIPAGTTVFEGLAGPQRGLVGGGHQAFLTEAWARWVVEQGSF